MLDCANIVDPFHCPTKAELFQAIQANLPPGRCWQNVETFVANPFSPSEVGEFEVSGSGVGIESAGESLTVMEQFWLAYAEVLEWVHAQMCTLIDEMYCDTTDQLFAEWAAAYGFPDPCEPYSALCAKVNAQGGSSLAFLREIAARAGFIAVIDDHSTDGAIDPETIRVRVPADPDAPIPVPFEAGAAVAGCTEPCPPGSEFVSCLIERFKPAHVAATYEEL